MTPRMMTFLSLAATMAIGGFLATSQAAEPNPYLKADETWIGISGTAVAPTDDTFMLDYGQGTITVDMEGWDWFGRNAKSLDGDKVTVYGQIDDDLYDTTTIDARSVYVENLGTYFYASGRNDDDEYYDHDTNFWLDTDPIEVGRTTIRGTVTAVDDQELRLDTGLRELTVDVDEMPYNPLDRAGYQRIEVGDYVSVTGEMEDNFFLDRELMATAIVTLDQD